MRINSDETRHVLTDSTPPEAPYRGLEPFRFADRAIFFGRTDEAINLLRQVTIYRGMLFYGDSGVGKSSLINAGFIPAAIEAGFNPWTIRTQPRPGEEVIIEAIAIEGVSLSKNLSNETSPQRIVLSAAKFKEKVKSAAPEFGKNERDENEPVRPIPLLIFDQFEEFVTLFEEKLDKEGLEDARKAEQALLDMIAGLMRDSKTPVKLMFVFREEYLAKLGKLFAQCPNLTDQFIRLTGLQVAALPEIIHGPFEKFPEKYGEGFTKELEADLIASISARSQNDRLNLSEVQVACLQLWKSKDPHARLREKGVGGLIEDYLANIISLIPESHRDMTIILLGHLVTSAGTRNIVLKDELIERTLKEGRFKKAQIGKALDSLVNDSKIVRRVLRYDTDFYEIISEFLVPWIRQQKTSRAQAQRRKAFVFAAIALTGALIVVAIAVLTIKSRTENVLTREEVKERQEKVEYFTSLVDQAAGGNIGQELSKLYDEKLKAQDEAEKWRHEYEQLKNPGPKSDPKPDTPVVNPDQISISQEEFNRLKKVDDENRILRGEKAQGVSDRKQNDDPNKPAASQSAAAMPSTATGPQRPDPIPVIIDGTDAATTNENLSKIPLEYASSQYDRREVRLVLLDPDKKPIDESVEMSLKHSRLDKDERKDSSIDGSKPILVKNLLVVPDGKYRITIRSNSYKQTPEHIFIEASTGNELVIEMEPDLKKINRIKAPQFDELDNRLKEKLNESHLRGFENKAGPELYRAIDEKRKGSLLNLFAIMNHIKFSNDRTVFDYVTSIINLGDKDVMNCYAAQELESIVRDSQFFPGGKMLIGDVKLQLTFHESQNGKVRVTADIDLKQHSRDPEILKKMHPFGVRQLLIKNGMNPGYRLLP